MVCAWSVSRSEGSRRSQRPRNWVRRKSRYKAGLGSRLERMERLDLGVIALEMVKHGKLKTFEAIGLQITVSLRIEGYEESKMTLV